MTTGFTFGRLRVLGRNQQSAELSFRPGLNVVSGATGTGKTHILRCLEFLMGATTPPEVTDASRGYEEVEGEILAPPDIWTVRRPLAGGDALLYRGAAAEFDRQRTKVLGSIHQRDNTNRISGFYLQLCGLLGREVRKDAYGGKDSLSFRSVAPLILVEEERIISRKSPLGLGERGDETKENSVVGLLLTGVDDAAIIDAEKPKERTARLRVESALLQTLAQERTQELAKDGVDAATLNAQRAALDLEIADATKAVAVLQSQIDAEAKVRDAAWREIQVLRSRTILVDEQHRRLELLGEHYTSDRSRLLASVEAGRVYAELPSAECPVCGRPAETGRDRQDASERVEAFQAACAAEITKLDVLERDLAASMRDLADERSRLSARDAEVTAQWSASNQRIDVLTKHDGIDPSLRLAKLLKDQSKLIQLEEARRTADELRRRAEVIEKSKRKPPSKPQFAPRVETKTLAGLIEVMTQTLTAWRFPNLKTVGYDVARRDFTFGGQNRSALGKGHRALTHAAFVVSLMRYCRNEELPHPGVVILDTPLNPLRGPDEPGQNKVNQDVQDAFYADLAERSGPDQVIVLENTPPAERLRERMNYAHFTRNPSLGRFGFYPVRGA